MSNQTQLPIDRNYPERFTLPDSLTSWNYELPEYTPPLNLAPHVTIDKLEEYGIFIPDSEALKTLPTLSNEQAASEYGDTILKLRHPLGRTGINGAMGTAIQYASVGESGAADMAILRMGHIDLELALVYNRNKWSLPGGFCDNDEELHNRRSAAIREAREETSLNLSEIGGTLETLKPKHIKPNSRRSTDLAYLTNQVEVFFINDPEAGDSIEPGDDAEAVAWCTLEDIWGLKMEGKISTDHYQYALDALQWGDKRTS